MQVEECVEQIAGIPEEVKMRIGKIRELDCVALSEKEKIRRSVEQFFNVAKTLSDAQRESHWMAYRRAMVRMERVAVGKIEQCNALKETLKGYAERLKLEVDRGAHLLEEEDPGVVERIRRNRRAEKVAQENARLMRDMQKLRTVHRIKAARRKRLNQLRHRRPSTSVKPSALVHSPLKSELNALSPTEMSNIQEEVKVDVEEPLNIQLEERASNKFLPVIKPDYESQAILKLLTEHGESRHGRIRKVSSRVSNGLMYELRAKELAMRRLGKSTKKSTPRKRTHTPTPSSTPSSTPTVTPPPLSSPLPPSTVKEVGPDSEVKTDENEDDDNRAWCICKQPSYGFMVACDSSDCPYVWFHSSCIGIESEIRGKWYCAHCTQRLGIQLDLEE